MGGAVGIIEINFYNTVNILHYLPSSMLKRFIQLRAHNPRSILYSLLNKVMEQKAEIINDANISKRPLRVSIEGNIGCGKSTIISYFTKFPEVDARQEPLEKWTDLQGHNLLMLSYADPKRWNFTFSHYVQLSRLALHTQSSNKRIQIFERSIQNNRYCFVEIAHKTGLLADPDYAAMCEWYDWIENNMDIGLDLIVYLRSSPRVVYDRMQRRGRPEESPVSLDYLTQLHEHYERWLVDCPPESLPAPVLVVDVDEELDKVRKMYETVEHYVLGRKALPENGYVQEFGWGAEGVKCGR